MGNAMGNTESTTVSSQYGLKVDSSDSRDKRAKFKSKQYAKVVDKVDLRKYFGDVSSKNKPGNNSRYSVVDTFMGLLNYELNRSGNKIDDDVIVNKSFLRYNEQVMANVKNDETINGTSIRNMLKSLNTYGIFTEEKSEPEMEYSYELDEKPADEVYELAKKYQNVFKYKRVKQDIEEMRTAISNGYPIIFGFNVFENFESKMINGECWDPSQNSMPLPSGKQLGQHSAVIVGYSDKRECFLVQNSQGSDWGMNGYFMMKYDFVVSENCMDFWIIECIGTNEKVEKIEKAKKNSMEPELGLEPEPEPEPKKRKEHKETRERKNEKKKKSKRKKNTMETIRIQFVEPEIVSEEDLESGSEMESEMESEIISKPNSYENSYDEPISDMEMKKNKSSKKLKKSKKSKKIKKQETSYHENKPNTMDFTVEKANKSIKPSDIETCLIRDEQ